MWQLVWLQPQWNLLSVQHCEQWFCWLHVCSWAGWTLFLPQSGSSWAHRGIGKDRSPFRDLRPQSACSRVDAVKAVSYQGCSCLIFSEQRRDVSWACCAGSSWQWAGQLDFLFQQLPWQLPKPSKSKKLGLPEFLQTHAFRWPYCRSWAHWLWALCLS